MKLSLAASALAFRFLVSLLTGAGHAADAPGQWRALPQAPGIAKQSEIFTDAGGHGKMPVIALVTYVNFACIHRTSPVGLNDPQPELDKLSPDLKPLLQRIAWEAATVHPLSGVHAR
jgi:hypothetical protein